MSSVVTLQTLRRLLFGVLALGMAGTLAELLLIGHVEDARQLVPVGFLGVGLPAVLWHALTLSRPSRTVLQIVMVLFVGAGLFGVYFHFEGNAEFELEMTPALGGMELFRETMTGATPVLAPGTLSVFGLMGLVGTYGRGAGEAGPAADR